MQKKVWFKNNKGQKLAGVLHLPNKKGKQAGVIFCHGFTGGKDYNWFPEMAEALSKKNIIALRFDFAGNRDSEGKFEEMTYTQKISDLRSALDYLWKMGIRRIGVTGESLGGGICILTALEDHRIKALALTAPIVYPWVTHMRRLTRGERLVLKEKGQRIFEDPHKPGYALKLNRTFYEDAKKYNILKAVKNLRKPTLILQGTADQLVFAKETKKLYQEISSEIKEYILFPGSDHSFRTIPKHTKRRNQLIVQWFKKYLARESKTVTSFLEHKGKILIVKRNPTLNYPGHWNGISGYVNPGELMKKRALTEIEEETGIKAKELKFKKAGKPYRIVDRTIDKIWFSHPFLFQSKTSRVKLDWENTAHRWIKPESLKKYKTVPDLEKGLKRVI